MDDQDQMALVTHALHHLEICYENALEQPIYCPGTNEQLYEDYNVRIAPTDGGVLVFLVSQRCEERLAKGPIKNPACRRKQKPYAAVWIVCTPAETQAMMAELELWLRMEGE